MLSVHIVLRLPRPLLPFILPKASGCINDKNGNILFNQEEITARWVEYITELYEDHREQMPKFEVTSGANILKEEVQKALKTMKYGKATGPDDLPPEALKALDEHSIEIITSLCNIIYNSGRHGKYMENSTKLSQPQRATNTLISHLYINETVFRDNYLRYLSNNGC